MRKYFCISIQVRNEKCKIHILLFSGGTTFHTGLHMKIGNDYLPLDPESMNTLRKQFERMMVVIIDEMSLISADFFYNIHRRFKEILQHDEMFGDRGVMLVGDILQIPPVKQTNHGITYLHLKFKIKFI